MICGIFLNKINTFICPVLPDRYMMTVLVSPTGTVYENLKPFEIIANLSPSNLI